MDRKEFCAIVSEYRKTSEIKMKEICFQMSVMPTAIYRLEKGDSNFSMENMLMYLQALRLYLNLYKNDCQSVYHIQSFDDLKNTIILLRQEQNLSQRKLAEQAGCGHITIANFERNKNTITIDVFLKIIDVLGYQLKIEQL